MGAHKQLLRFKDSKISLPIGTCLSIDLTSEGLLEINKLFEITRKH